MANTEEAPRDIHPEGLTLNQERLVDMFFDTKQMVPVTRRIAQVDGTYRFVKIERLASPIDFAQDGEFVLKEHEEMPAAPLSPFYVNLRNLPEDVIDQVGLVLSEVGVKDVDSCCGIPNAGLPLAEAYSRHSGVQEVEIFEKVETSEGRRIVAKKGINGAGKKIRIIDDVAARGNTKIEAINAAEGMGFAVVDVLVVIDRGQGAVEAFEKVGRKLIAAFTLDQALRYGVRTGRCTRGQYEQAKEYLEGNRVKFIS